MDPGETTVGPAQVVSPLAEQVMDLNKGAAYARLVVAGPGDERAGQLLGAATAAGLLGGPVRSEADAQAMMGALWLWHDWLDRCHTIAQGNHTATGSFWHAIMHRREGDFDNSKYWYARAKEHPMMEVMAAQAAELLNPLPADHGLMRVLAGGWSPQALVDLVQEVEGRPDDPRRPAAIAIQQAEWRVLFDYCTLNASGR